MQNLRNAHYIARFMLVWFALYVGVAIASPLVSPKSTQLVCSASGTMKVVSSTGDAGEPSSSHTLDCPLCAGVGAPPSLDLVTFDATQPLAYAAQSIASAHIATATAAPLPARGPPALL